MAAGTRTQGKRGALWECWQGFGDGGGHCGIWISPRPWRSIRTCGRIRPRCVGDCPDGRGRFNPAPTVTLFNPRLSMAAHPDALLPICRRGPRRKPSHRAPGSPRGSCLRDPSQLAVSQRTDAFQSSANRPTAVWSRLLTVPTGIRRIPAISA